MIYQEKNDVRDLQAEDCNYIGMAATEIDLLILHYCCYKVDISDILHQPLQYSYILLLTNLVEGSNGSAASMDRASKQLHQLGGVRGHLSCKVFNRKFGGGGGGGFIHTSTLTTAI